MRPVALAAILLLGSACTAAPAVRFDREATRLGLEPHVVTGGSHPLRVYAPAAGFAPAAGRSLHIYLDGDGRPFVHSARIARDPTPQDPLALRLLAADPGPALYLGRPCYHGLEPRCDSRYWTVARYGETVVASMAAAVEALADEHAPARVVLIGYSGGGALATLIAARLPAVDVLVTIAGNLDLDAWTRLHGYTPLAESLDPGAAAAAFTGLQLHYTGSEDDNVPPALQAKLAARLPGARFRVIEGYGHRCCWAETWPRRLSEIDAAAQAFSAAPPGPRPAR